jgi:hypothetical protein
LFASVGIGKFNSIEEGNNNLQSAQKYVQDTKVDMHFLVNLAHHYSKIPEIKRHLFSFLM